MIYVNSKEASKTMPRNFRGRSDSDVGTLLQKTRKNSKDDAIAADDFEAEGDAEENELAAEQDLEDDEYDAIEEYPATLKISSTIKEPVPGEEHAEPETGEPPAATIPKPHFKMPRSKPEQEPSEREVVMNQLNEAALVEDMLDYELPRIEMLEQRGRGSV